jgi:GrpB-like predicted nucleotidyltransferase (UPF0157 family)
VSSLVLAANEPVEVHDYDPRWPALFEAERDAIHAVLPDAFIDIQHIGSTAVPGLQSKPIIDLLGGIKDGQSTDAFNEPLSRLGYVPATAFNNIITDHLWFMRASGGHRTHQFHVLVHGSEGWVRRVRFRDALRSRPELAQAYAKLKLELAVKYRFDRAAYTNGKTDFVLSVTRDA